MYNRELKKFVTKSLVQDVLAAEPTKANCAQICSSNPTVKNSLRTWASDGLVSELTKAKVMGRIGFYKWGCEYFWVGIFILLIIYFRTDF